jgi:hypothetical protein
MMLQNTIKIPVSERSTPEKLSILNRLTARLTYGEKLFIDRIIE